MEYDIIYDIRNEFLHTTWIVCLLIAAAATYFWYYFKKKKRHGSTAIMIISTLVFGLIGIALVFKTFQDKNLITEVFAEKSYSIAEGRVSDFRIQIRPEMAALFNLNDRNRGNNPFGDMLRDSSQMYVYFNVGDVEFSYLNQNSQLVSTPLSSDNLTTIRRNGQQVKITYIINRFPGFKKVLLLEQVRD